MQKTLKIFTSMKTAIVIIAVLTVLSIIGTLIPQNQEYTVYLSKYPNLSDLLLFLGFDDIYHSKIFIYCLALLAISTIICTSIRGLKTYNYLYKKIEDKTIDKIKSLNLNAKINYINEDNIKDYKTIKEDNFGSLKIKRSGTLALLGALILHIGLVLILIGGFYGLISGVETSISGYKEQTIPIVDKNTLKQAIIADKLSKKARFIRYKNSNDPILNYYREEVTKAKNLYDKALLKPAFTVKFNELTVLYNKKDINSGISDWISNISFIENNNKITNKTVKVNNPVTYDGYTFYQAGWGKTYNKIKVRVELSSKASEADIANWNIQKNNFPLEAELTLDSPLLFEWCNKKIELISFYPDLRLMNGKAVTMTNELNNPAAQIIAHDPNKQWRAWAFPNPITEMMGRTSNMPFNFYFISATPAHLSTLTVKYDPGENIMWLGCFLFSIGMIMCFSGIYKEEWIFINKQGKHIIAVTGNRNNTLYKKYFETMKESFNQQN